MSAYEQIKILIALIKSFENQNALYELIIKILSVDTAFLTLSGKNSP
jgi:hypothetical protein